MENKAQKYLESHPELQKLYGTSDGFLFEKEQDARNHANTLVDKQVSTFAPKTVPQTGDEDDTPLENREFLMARYEALTGKQVPSNIGDETLEKRVQELEVERFGNKEEEEDA